MAAEPESAEWWGTSKDSEVVRPMQEQGAGARPRATVMELFQKAVKLSPNEIALKAEQGAWTWKQYYDAVITATKSLVHLGVEQFDTVCIIGFNSPEWVIGNVASIAAGGKVAGIYTTNGPEACHYIADHCGAKVAIVEDEKQLQKFLEIREDLPNLKAIVMWKGEVPEGANTEDGPVYSWAEFMKLGEQVDSKIVDERIAVQKPGNCCTLIYTSGTTGRPKAVMISHDNLTWTASLVKAIYKDELVGELSIVSYLPLSHIAAQMLDIHSPIFMTSEPGTHCTVHFARPDALKGSLGKTLQEAQPHIFFGVPRVWEKMAEAMKAKGAETTGLKKSIATWAKERGRLAFEEGQTGGTRAKPWGHTFASMLVFKNIRKALGFDRCKVFLTGAAPITKETLAYFGALDICIFELYGMSECTGPQTISTEEFHRVGSCGPSLPGTEIKIFHQEGRDKEGEGEICYRGRHIMMGYLNNPEKTAETIDDEGWLHSGDVGRVDKAGMLYITGRIKELIITAGGENIAPVPVEDYLKEFIPGISNAVMIGDKRKFCSVLLTLHTEANEDGTFTDKLTGPSLLAGSTATTVAEAQTCEVWKKHIEAGREKYNAIAVSSACKVQKWVILPVDFSVTSGELTPTLKLKRPVVVDKYHDTIESLYN